MPQRRLGFIDVGARGGAPELTVQFGDRLHIVMIEPEPAEYRRLQAAIAGDPKASVIGTALADIDGDIPFHKTPCGALPVRIS